MNPADAVRVTTSDGVTLGLWRAAGPPATKPIPLLLMHGTFSTRHFFGAPQGLGAFLADLGYDAWIGELRGHARGDEKRPGDFDDWILRDAPALLRGVREATGAERVVWIGHSAGAVVAVGAASYDAEVAGSLAGLVMVAAPAPDRPGSFHAAVSVAGYLVSRMWGHVPASALGIGPADEAAAILEQWTGWIRKRSWTSRDGFDYLAHARGCTAPALAIAGAGDLLTPPATCRRLLDALGSTDRTMVVCGRARGFARSYTHNRVLISSDARREVWPLIADWIGKRF